MLTVTASQERDENRPISRPGQAISSSPKIRPVSSASLWRGGESSALFWGCVSKGTLDFDETACAKTYRSSRAPTSLAADGKVAHETPPPSSGQEVTAASDSLMSACTSVRMRLEWGFASHERGRRVSLKVGARPRWKIKHRRQQAAAPLGCRRWWVGAVDAGGPQSG